MGWSAIDETGAVVRDALLWNGHSLLAALELTMSSAEPVSGPKEIVSCRSPPSRQPSCVGCDNEPASRRPNAAVCLPHDGLTWRLAQLDRHRESVH